MTSVSWRRVHSPWLFSLLQSIQDEGITGYAFEKKRHALLHDETPVPALDLGAGSQSKSRTVGEIARSALKRPLHAHAIATLSKHIKSVHVLELGTCLGITTAYLSQSATRVTTIEGNPALKTRASLIWDELGIANITSIVGDFDEVIPTLANQQFDLIFIDGNHRGDALLRYVDALSPQLSSHGVIVCDDIHWSPDMEDAWIKLTSEKRWSLKVDFYEWGLLTKNPNLASEFHAIRF